jgi:hypothetical protein
MEKSHKESERNDILGELLVDMVQNGEHSLCVSDILVSFMNNRLLQEERDEIMEQMEKLKIMPRSGYAHQIAMSGKKPTKSQIKQCMLSSLEDGRYLQSIRDKWDDKGE